MQVFFSLDSGGTLLFP